jgi:hypothetical protein
MRTHRSRHWVSTRLGIGLLSLCLLGGLSGCWSVPNAEDSAMVGAGTGALIGGVFGCSFAYSFSSAHHQETAYLIGCPVGVAAGAAVGGLLGYLMWGPPSEYKQQMPAPPAPPPPPAPAMAPPPLPAMKEKSLFVECTSTLTRPRFGPAMQRSLTKPRTS